MNSIKKFLSILTVMAIIGSLTNVSAATPKKSDQQNYKTIKGKVVDKNTGDALIFATVAVIESNVATVTNLDGEFSLKITSDQTATNLEVSYIGYKNLIIPISELKENGDKNTISLQQALIPIKEIVVKPLLPEEVLVKSISLFEKNYTDQPNLMTAFYRETIKKNKTYVSIGEAVLEIFKAPYNNDFRFDATKIYKGRKNSDNERLDTVLFKLQGGPVTTLQLDLVKNPESILTIESMDYYVYQLTNVVVIDEKPHYVISFEQKPNMESPLYLGKFYIDMESYAISEVEFEFNLEDKEKAAPLFIRKKPLGMSVTPEIATYRVKYREQAGKWYFAYSRAEVKFEVNWKKKLFNTMYTTMSELAVTDRTDQEVIKFESRSKVRTSDVFSEKVSAFTDPDFWGEYNVIEPDQSIESAIRKLNRRLRFSDR